MRGRQLHDCCSTVCKHKSNVPTTKPERGEADVFVDRLAKQHVWFLRQDHGKTSATASLGLITLWDVEGGLPQIDKYLYSQDPAVVAGALLGVGIINSSVQVPVCTPVLAQNQRSAALHTV